jgi:hypothetical protein
MKRINPNNCNQPPNGGQHDSFVRVWRLIQESLEQVNDWKWQAQAAVMRETSGTIHIVLSTHTRTLTIRRR